MSIASRIQAIEQHLTDDYNVLEVAGADLTNVNKNILNLKTTWQERLLYFINNGTDVVWNNWDKVTGEGTTLTLNNTEEAPMKIDLKGNTSQEGTPTPDTPQDIHVVSGDNSINVVGKNLFEPTTKVNGTNIIVANGSVVLNDDEYTLTATGTDCYFGQVLSSGGSYIDNRGELINVEGMSEITFTITNASFNNNFITAYNSSKVSLGYTQFNSNIGTYTIPSNAKYITIRFGLTAVAGNSYSTKVQIEKGSTPSEYEKHIGNTYPINLPVENLWHLDNATNNGVTLTNNDDGSITLNGTCTSTNQFRTTFDTPLSSDTYTLSFVSSVALSTGSLFVRTRNSNGVLAQNIDVKVTSANQTVTSDIKYLDITIINGVTYNNVNLKIQLEKGSKANSYTPYGTTPIELCKIGNYQDVIKKSTGKNLFIPASKVDDTNISTTRCLVSLSGDEYTFQATGSDCYFGNVVGTGNAYNKVLGTLYDVEGLTNIVFKPTNSSFDKNYACYYNNNKVSIGYAQINNSTGLITLPTGTKYVNFRIGINNSVSGTSYSSKFQLEIGNQATSFEPYGTGWYLKKEIGKVILNGSETLEFDSNNLIYKEDNIRNYNAGGLVYCNYYLGTANGGSANVNLNAWNGNAHNINIKNNSIANLNDFKTWLGTHNTIVYYILATPTYTEITDSTLISQLNALAKSYTSQTNISQESNDLPFIINATALKEME